MRIRLSNAPCSWGIEFADNVNNQPWQHVLGEMSSAGYQATELGPLGYLPTEQNELSSALSSNKLELIAGTLFDYLHRPEEKQAILDKTKWTCQILKQQNARYLVIIDHVCSPRTDEAGQVKTASRLDDERWQYMVQTLKEVGEICNEYGIVATYHPHAGTFVEYKDEVDKLMKDVPKDLLSLCVDTGHCKYAGIDPAELIRRYAERVKYIHFKDLDPIVHRSSLDNNKDFYQSVSDNIFCPLGKGCVDFDDVKHALQAIGYDGWITVEQDTDLMDVANVQEDATKSRVFIEQTFLQPSSTN